MQQRKWFYVVGLILLVLSGLVFLIRVEDASESEPSSGFTSSGGDQSEKEPRLAEPAEINTSGDLQRESRNRELQFTATALPAPPENVDAIVHPEYQFGGSSIGGATRDRARNLIWRATKDRAIYGISISPDNSKIAVRGGDAKAYILTNEGQKIADLPRVPPGRDTLGLGNWFWFDNHRLLGESGVQNFDESGKPVGCCQGHNMSESRYYVYDLRTNQMEEMQLPENLRGKVLMIPKVLKTGEFQLGHEPEGFGWYQITVTELGEDH